MATLWPFSRKESTINKDQTNDLAMSLQIGAELASEYSSTQQNADLKYFADVLAANPLVHACISEIAMSVGAIDYRPVIARGGTEEDFRGPFAEVLNNPYGPNNARSKTDWIEELIFDLYIYGNVYVYLAASEAGRGRVTSLQFLRPDLVTINLSPDVAGGVKSYTFTPSQGAQGVEIPADQICHMRMPNNSSGRATGNAYGISPLSYIKNDVLMDAYLSDLAMSYVKSSGIPAGILKLRSTQINDPEQAAEIRRRWSAALGGKNAWQVALLDADAEYQPLSPTGSGGGIALPDVREEIQTKISLIFQIPQILIGSLAGVHNSSYNSYKNAMVSFRDELIYPTSLKVANFLTQISERAFSGGAYVVLDTSKSPQWAEDVTAQSKRVESQYSTGIISLSEARDLLGYDPLPNNRGDVRRTPANVFEVPISAPSPPSQLEASGEKMISLDTGKGLELPVLPEIEQPRSGPVPIEGADRLMSAIRSTEQANINRLAGELERGYFAGVISNINGRTGRLLEDDTRYTPGNPYPWKASELVPDSLTVSLQNILIDSAERVVKDVYKAISDTGLLPSISPTQKELTEIIRKALGDEEDGYRPSLAGRFIAQAVTAATRQALWIAGTTRKAVESVLSTGMQEGLTVSQMTQGLTLESDGRGFKGLKSVMAGFKNRIPTIARNQVATVTNLSSLNYYEDSGIGKTMALDGTEFDATCAARDGRIYTLSEAAGEQEHPNGVLSWTPVVDRGTSLGDLSPRLAQEIQITKERTI